MSEAEWLRCTDAMSMLAFLRDTPTCVPTFRQLRLLACACCRHAWDLLIDARSREAVEVGQLYAEGVVSEMERGRACQAAMAAREEMYLRWIDPETYGPYDSDVQDAAAAAVITVLTDDQLRLWGGLAAWDRVMYLGRFRIGRKLWDKPPPTEDAAPHLIRSILGNPFRSTK